MKKIFLYIFTIYCFYLSTHLYGLPVSLNVLTPMRILDPILIRQFEQENDCQVNVEFMSNYNGYDSHLRSEIQLFDVVIADEKSLIQLTTTNMLRSLPEELRQKNSLNSNSLQVKNQFNAEVNTYVPLFGNPIGIAYNKDISLISKNATWDVLIDADKNPYWRQRVFISNDKTKQIAVAALATHESLKNKKKLPENVTAWLSKLSHQRAQNTSPLELAFLSKNVNAAILMYSEYLRYKNILPFLEFFVPAEGTYFERFGIGWCLSSIQEKLAVKFIAFMIENSGKFSKFNHFIDVNENHETVSFTSWRLYDESEILPFLPSPVLGR